MSQYSPRIQSAHQLWLGALLAAGLAACGSQAPTPGPGPGPVGAPFVRSVDPGDGAMNVPTRGAVTADVQLLSAPGGNNAINPTTITDKAVYLIDTNTNTVVPGLPNTTGGGDAIVLNYNALKANTKYMFEVTGDVKDLNGNSFRAFHSTFTTGATTPTGPNVFTRVAQPNVPGNNYTAVEIGPDRKLYAATLTGEILRFPIGADGTLGVPQHLTSLQAQQGPRTIIGLKFDPKSTADNLLLWISNNNAYDFQKQVPDWTGKVTLLSGPNLETVQDVVVGLPRSTKDHMTNSVSFKPNEPNALYILQGANNSYGAPDPIWDNRPEHLLSAALLRLDLTKVTPGQPLNVQTEDVSNPYNPYAPGAPLTLYATGIRNGYSMVWHSNGQLYVPTNGSAAGGNTPATPNPVTCTNRLDGRTSVPSAPALTNVSWTEPDFLFRIDQGGYYGHPNPTRCEYSLDGGNVGSSPVNLRVPDYPVGTLPDPNYRLPAFVFPDHTSADGVIEYIRPGSSLNGSLLVTRYSSGNDIVALPVNGDGSVGALQDGIGGLTNFKPNPLNLTEDTTNGNIYVAQLSYEDRSVPGTIMLVKPN